MLLKEGESNEEWKKNHVGGGTRRSYGGFL